MKKLDIATSVAHHLGISPIELPQFLFTDKEKKYPLEDDDDKLLGHYNEDSLFSLKTVRFLKDFSRFKSGVQKETTNKSFLRSAELFKRLNVKNYFFHLQLNNPLLLNVDPWNPELTEELQFMVMTEATENFWYILRELIRIDGRRFIGNRAVLSFIWCCLNHLNTLILLPRQTGKMSWDKSVVKVPGGWSHLDALKVGDTILTPKGKPTTVTGVYPHGKQPVYAVEFEDGRVHECGPEHLWKFFDTQTQTFSVNNTLMLLEKYQAYKNTEDAVCVPACLPEDGPEVYLPIDPFMLGELFAKKKISAFNPIRPTRQDSYLKACGLLNKTVEGYYVPEEFRHAQNAHQRLSLLQGMLNRIGQVTENGQVTCLLYSAYLAKHIQFMARSLGMLCHIDEELHHDATHEIEYRLTFRARNIATLFSSEVKKTLCEQVQERMESWDGLIRVKQVRLLTERKSCRCIEVDDEEHLFVTDDFIVTHNTVGLQVMFFILQYIIGRGYKTGLITLASNNRQQFVNAVKKIRSGVPEYLVSMSYKDKDSGNIMTYQGHGVKNNNIFEIRVPNGGKDGAENVARGSSFGALGIDEPAWTKFIENIISGSGPSTLREQKNMLEKGMPWFSAQTTTPNSILKEEGRYMYGEYLSSTPWKESFFDCFSESHLFDVIIKNSPKKTTFPKVVIQYNHLQLGFGENWVIETMDQLKLSWSKAKIDLLMMWTEEGKDNIFDDKTRELLNKCKEEHVRFQAIEKTSLFYDWFIDEAKLQQYIDAADEFIYIGCDTSDAKGEDSDACTVTMRRGKTGEVIGTGRYSLAYLGDVRDVILYLLVSIPNSLLIIERNRAQQIIDDLLIMLPALGFDPFLKLYNEIYQNPLKHPIEYRDVQQTKFAARTKAFYLKYKSKFGFQTNSATRPILYGLIYEAVQNTGSGIRYSALVDELVGLRQGANGRIDHVVKGHDDIIISWLLTYWFMKLGYNKELYKIPSGSTLVEIRTLAEGVNQNKYTQSEILEFGRIREKINEHTTRLLKCDNEMIIPRIESEIKKLSQQLPNEIKKLITIDEVINNARLERNKRKLAEKRKQRLGYY